MIIMIKRNVLSTDASLLQKQVQAMQAIKVSTAKLKEDIKAQNHIVYVEKSHIEKELSRARGANAMIKRREIEDLQRTLNELEKKKLLEQHAYRTVEEHFDELQATLQTITASWGTKMAVDSDLKLNTLEVNTLELSACHQAEVCSGGVTNQSAFRSSNRSTSFCWHSSRTSKSSTHVSLR